MQLPREGSTYGSVCQFARYVTYRLALAGRDAAAKELTKATRAALEAGRAWEDADEPYQLALARRDAALDALALAAKTARAALAGRGANAAREEPYTLVFSDGMDAYTLGPVATAKARYGRLRVFLERNLEPKDPARVAAVKGLRDGLARLAEGLEAVVAAERGFSEGRAELDGRLRALRRALEKTYGSLVADVGRAEADRCFPRLKRGKREPKG